MSYIFLDESGDLGFDFTKRKTSKFFLVTFLVVKEPRPLEKIVSKVFSGFSKKQIRAHGGALHCHKEHPKVRIRVLSKLVSKDVKILVICLNKRKVYTQLQDEKHVLYNYVTNILLDRLYTKGLVGTDTSVEIVAARRETNRFLNQNFEAYLKSQVAGKHKMRIGISIKAPSSEKCLQLVDFVSWAIFRKYERRDISYYKLIEGKIVEENSLFPP